MDHCTLNQKTAIAESWAMLESLKSLLPVTNFSQQNLHTLKVPWPSQISKAGTKDSNPKFPQWMFSIKLKHSSQGPHIFMIYLMARTFSISLMFPLSLFYFTVFLLINRYVHIWILTTLTFHHFQVCPFHTWDPSPKEKKRKRNFLKSPIWSIVNSWCPVF